MKKLCFGSLVTVLKLCKAHGSNQKLLCGTMLLSIDSSYNITTDDNTTSALATGTTNLSDIITGAAPHADKQAVLQHFKNKVSPMLDSNKLANIALALQDIISLDDDIKPDTIVELISGMTKADIVKRSSFVFESLIAGLFLYTCRYPQNRGISGNIREITAEYIASFDVKTDSVSFISAYSSFNSALAKEIAADAHSVVLLTETGGKCQKCGRNLGAKKEGNDVSYATTVTLSDNEDIILCVDCAREIENIGEDEKAQLIAQRQELSVLSETRDEVSRQRLESQIEELLREIDNVDITEDTPLRTLPVEVDKKISEKRLRDRVRADVTQLYDAVNNALDRLSGENKLNVDKFAKSIKRMYEDSVQLPSQSDIYNLLVDTLFEKTGRKHREACGVVISYFVQRCEVFDEIAE